MLLTSKKEAKCLFLLVAQRARFEPFCCACSNPASAHKHAANVLFRTIASQTKRGQDTLIRNLFVLRLHKMSPFRFPSINRNNQTLTQFPFATFVLSLALDKQKRGKMPLFCLWRRGRDSNSRRLLHLTPFPGVHHRPLRHLCNPQAL